MAGPGGGPPRRSHTKSRKGCDVCKRRHIRCDENFPQCNNCTKHKCRCPYNDNEETIFLDKNTDTPGFQQTVKQAALSRVNPPSSLSNPNDRLLHHIQSVSYELIHLHGSNFTVWSHYVPLFIKIGVDHAFVMHALLALSATHQNWQTRCSLSANQAYEHRVTSIVGLHKALDSFSQQNSDAVLAASLILSWQENDWFAWSQLALGTLVIISEMRPWKDNSLFKVFIEEQLTFFNLAPSSLDVYEYDELKNKHSVIVQKAISQLQLTDKYLRESDPSLSESIQQLLSFTLRVQGASPNITPKERFEILNPLRAWLLWKPVAFLRQSRGSLSALVTIAYYYTIALVVEPFFPEVGTAYFGTLCLNPIHEILRQFSFYLSEYTVAPTDRLNSLMKFPEEIVNYFENRIGLIRTNLSPTNQISDVSDTHSSVRLPSNIPVVSDRQEHNVFISPNQLSDNPLSVNPLSANYMPYKTPTDASHPHIPSPKFGESLLSPASSSFEEGQSFSVSKQEDNISFYDGQNLSRNFAGFTLDNREPRSFEIESVHLGLAVELPESREIPIESQQQLSEPIGFAAFARKGKDRQD
ncbi:hypothetical protein K3495_g11117 [Podosphaera aphanis]|nr:hypothetical protein K3495_g11117 [Podosphaera aphanis]